MKQDQQIVPIEIRHSVLIDDRKVNEKDIGASTNRLKRVGYSTYKTTQDIMNAMGNGKPAILAAVEMAFKNPHDSHTNINNKRFGFLHTSMFALKIEDRFGEVDPGEVLQVFKDEALGLVFLNKPSEEKILTKNSYHYYVLFQLDQAINNEMDIVELGRFFRQRLLTQFPIWSAETVNVLRPTVLLSNGYRVEVCSYSNFVEIGGYITRLHLQREQLQKNKLAWLSKERKQPAYIPPFDELKRMVECIGNIQEENSMLWPKIVTSLKNHEILGMDLSADQGLELFRLLSNQTEPDATYINWIANGLSTVGTLTEHAQRKGYQRQEFINVLGGNLNQILPTQFLKVNRYLSPVTVKEFLRSGDRILMDSPTGSGKTTALITAAKELATEYQDNHFFLFAVPTTSLVDQLTQKYELFGLQGGMTKVDQKVRKEIEGRNRCFITTYDKTNMLVDFIHKELGDWNYSYTLIVDEVHKMVDDYDFRSKAIIGLYELFDSAQTLIGLSGTTEDVLMTSFNKKVLVHNGQAQSPCKDFFVYEYQGLRKHQLKAIQELILERVQQGKKLLVFLQNKKLVQTINTTLKKEDIQSDYLDGESKNRRIYKELMKNECFPAHLDVLLSTSVAADGINIENPVNCECLVVCSSLSDLANPSGIKQMSNRFRNPYDRFSLFIENPQYEETVHFNIDKAFNRRLHSAQEVVRVFESQYDKNTLHMYEGAFLEQKYGISLSEQNSWSINQLLLRHQSSQDKTRYYIKYRRALIKVTERLLGQTHKVISIGINTNTIESNDGSQKSDFPAFETVFTKEVFEDYQKGHSPEIRIFEEQLSSWHRKALRFLYPLATFYDCSIVIPLINNEQQRAQLEYRIKNLAALLVSDQLINKELTFRVCKTITEVKYFLSSAEWQAEFTRIGRIYRVDPRLVEETAKLYFVKASGRSKDKNTRLNQLNLLSIKNVADKYGLKNQQLKGILSQYADLHLKADHKSLLLKAFQQYDQAS